MYCRRCGKEIEYVSEICIDCQKELLAENPTPVDMPKSKLGGAITFFIIAFFMTIYFISNTPAAIAVIEKKESIDKSPYGIFMWFILLLLSTISFERGIASIKHFRKCSKMYGKKYVATLVLGILCVVLSSIAITLATIVMHLFI